MLSIFLTISIGAPALELVKKAPGEILVTLTTFGLNLITSSAEATFLPLGSRNALKVPFLPVPTILIETGVKESVAPGAGVGVMLGLVVGVGVPVNLGVGELVGLGVGVEVIADVAVTPVVGPTPPEFIVNVSVTVPEEVIYRKVMVSPLTSAYKNPASPDDLAAHPGPGDVEVHDVEPA